MFRRLILIVMLAVLVQPARAEMYEIYGTREPNTCGPFTTLSGASPTSDEAAWIYLCEYESQPIGVASKLYLVEDLSIQVGRSRPFGQTTDYSLRDADPSQQVFPIRGTLTLIQCSEVNDRNRGANCAEYPSKGEGVCYRSTFDEWSCPMTLTDAGEWRTNVPPRR